MTDALCKPHERPEDICAECPCDEWSEWEDLPRCPHCGAADQDWWDGAPNVEDGSRFGSSCGRCGRDYEVRVSISPEFCTRALAGEKEAA